MSHRIVRVRRGIEISLLWLAVLTGVLQAQTPTGTISTFAGGGNSKNDGVLATDYRLFQPSDVAIDSSGNFFLADFNNHKIMKVDRTTLIITTVAGNGTPGYSGDGGPASSAELNGPIGIAFDPISGDLFISDTNNARIRRVHNEIITTYAGTGIAGYNGDNIPATAARLNTPYHICFDRLGNLYIASSNGHRIRMVNTAGIIFTVAGTGNDGYNGDDLPATNAELKNPRGVLMDSSGNLYIADFGNHRIRVVRGGKIYTYAGTGKNGSTGDGDLATSARLEGPNNLGMDAAGNLYIADDQDNKVRQVNQTTNIINTVAGNGDSGYSGDGGPAVDAAISRAFSATFDQQGQMYIASFGTDVVRVVNFAGTASSITVESGSPQSAIVNTAFPQRLTAVVKDSNGTVVPGISVSFSAPGSGASATLSPTTAVSDIHGEVSVAATANSAVGSYVVNASATGVSAPAAFNLTNTAGAVSQITFEQQPHDSHAGSAITPAVTVRVRDTNGNPISGASVSVSLSASLTLVRGTQTVFTDTTGLATFNDLRIEVTGTHILLATSGGLSATSAPFQVTAAAASHIEVYFGNGQSAYVTTSYTHALVAKVTDTYGNAISGVTVTFAAPDASGPSVVFAPGNPVVTTGTDGIATSPSPLANDKAGTFSVSANITGSAAAFPLTNLPGEAAVLIFEQQPASSVTAGVTMTPPIAVRVTDTHGNPVAAGTPVAMSMTGPSQSLTGGLITNTDASGRALFPTLGVLVAGTGYQLVATAGTGSARSNPFTVVAGVPSKIEIVIGTPQSAAITTTYVVPLRVLVRDGLQNAVTGASVNYTAPGGPGPSGLFGGSSTKSVQTDATGRAETTVTANSTAGNFTVTAAVTGLSGVVTFSLTNTPGTPQTLTFTQQPPASVAAGTTILPPVRVLLTDTGGNPLSGVPILLTPRNVTLGMPVGSPFTATTDSTGGASFPTLRLDLAGTYELDATGAGTEGLSSRFQVTPGAPTTTAAYAGGGQSAVVGTAFGAPLQAIVTDSFTNPIANVPVTFEVITGTTAGGTFGMPATVNTQPNGIAMAPLLTANTVAGTFRVRASVVGMAQIQAEFNLTNTPGAGLSVFVQQPTDTSAGVSMPPITVHLQDQFNNPIQTQGVPVTLHLNAPPSSQFTEPPISNTDSGGIATFNAYSVDKAGIYVLDAQAPGIQSGTSRVFTILAGPPATVSAVGGTPQSSSVGTTFALPLVALVTDALANPINNVPITFTVNPSASGAGGTFSGMSTATTDAQGLAAAPNLTSNTFAGTFTVTATIGASTATWTLTNVAGAVKTISFPTEPSDTPAGSAISPPVVVKLQDENNNPVNGATVVLSAQVGPRSLTGTTTGTTNASGEATFSDLILTASGSYQLEASAAGVLGRSGMFSINARTTNLHMQILAGDSQAASVNTAYAEPLKVAVDDEYGNPVPGAPVTFSPSPGAASVTFAGPATVNTESNGVATSPALTANSVVGPVLVTASTPAAATPVTFNLSNISGAANHLTFTQPPMDSTAGSIIAPPIVVQLRDSASNPVLQGGVAVTVQLNPINLRSASLGGFTTQNTTADGTATFATLSVAQSGSYTLLAETPGVQSVVSNTFTVRIGQASTITATGGESQSAVLLSPFGAPLQVTVRDSSGNGVSGVTVAFAPPTSGASASLSATTATTDAAGNAAVNATANATSGSYMVTALASGVTGTATFSLTNLSGGATRAVFTQQPANTPAGATMSPVIVKLADAGGTPVAGTAITLSLDNSAATLFGTLTRSTNASGLATFDDLSIRTTGAYRLAATGASTAVLSNAFQITAAAAVSIMAFSGGGQSAAAGTAYAAPLKASVQDGFGNAIPGAPVTFSAPASGPSVAFAGGAMVNTDSTGLATSPLMTANTTTGSFQVTASTNGAGGPAAFPLTNTAGTAGRLTFVQQPTDTAAGASMSPPVTVQLLDSLGNPVRTAGVAVTLLLNPVVRLSRTLGGSSTQHTDSTGIATFANLSATQSGAYQLIAESDGLGSATSMVFRITTGQPANIRSSAGTPQSATVLTAFTIPLQAAVTDATGNPVAGVPIVFGAPTSGPSGTFGGATTVTLTTDAQGIASATLTANGIPGSYAVLATASAVTGSATFSMTNLAQATSVLAFVQQPTNAVSGQPIFPAVTVQVRDAAGHRISAAGIAVVMTLATGTGSLSGTPVQLTDSTGVATFGDLTIAQAGNKTLRAYSVSQAPADSSSFLITTGAAASVAVAAGAQQAAQVLQSFDTQLQALVRDASGNSVSGVQVTFNVPSTGSSGTFSGSATVATDASGIATAPPLTANSTPGNFTVTATTSGVVTPASFALTILPAPGGTLVLDDSVLTFGSELGQPAPAAQTIHVDTTNGVAADWRVTSSVPWLSANPSQGTTPATVAVSVNPSGLAPGGYSGSLTFTSTIAGQASLQVILTITAKPSLLITPPTLVFTTLNNTLTPPSQTVQTRSTSRPIPYNVTVQISTPSGGSWLQFTPAFGTTPGAVSVSANPAGLGNGVYDGLLRFTPTEAGLNEVTVPVTLVVGCQQGGCQLQPTILSVVNSGSFQPGGAPRTIMTIFGRSLSDGTYTATTTPLPGSLGPTSVMVDGLEAPLYYASPTQINFQMPSILPPGDVVVTVHNNVTGGTRAIPASPPYDSQLAEVHPGLFVTADNRAAALNGDLSVHTAATPIPAGGYVILYMTGEGPISPALPDGVAAPSSPLSIITTPVQVTIGGKPAQVTYQGVAPTLVGKGQLNVIVPSGLTPGDQPVFITMNGIASNTGLITLR